MSQIQTGRYSDLLRRLLSMKGVTDVASELSPEISPIFVLESERPEWEFLKNEKLMSNVFAPSPVAAQQTAVRIRNPSGSGAVAVFTRMWLSAAIPIGFIAERNTDQGNLTTVLPTVARDTRTQELNASALVASQTSNAAASGSSFWSSNLIGDTPAINNIPFILTPGNQIQITSLTVNAGLRGTLDWRERRLDVLEEGDG